MSSPSAGVWQSGKLLVVDIQQATFPNRCVWTNEPAAKPTPVEFKAELPFAWRYSLLQGLSHRTEFRNLHVTMPVSSQWDEPRKTGKKRIGKILFRTGLVLGLCCLGAFVWLFQYEGDPTKAKEALIPGIIAIATFPFALIGTVVGLAWPYLEGTPGAGGPIAAKLLDERLLWIEGAHPVFLATLPVWPGASLQESFADRGSMGEMLAKNWPYMLIAFFFWVVIIAAKVAVKLAIFK